MIETSSSNYLLVGSSRTHGGFNGGNMITKLDSLGNILWQKSYSPPCGDAVGYFIRELTGLEFLMSGTGIEYCQGGLLPYSYCSKLDTAGNLIWTKYIGGDQFAFRLHDIISDLDGGFVCIGSKDSMSFTSASIIKYDSSGNIIFNKEYLYSFGGDYSHGYNINDFVKIIQFQDSSFYLLGSANYNPTLFHLDKNGDSLSAILINDSLGPTEFNLIKDFKYKGDKLISCIQTLDTAGGHLTVAKAFLYENDIINSIIEKHYTTNIINCFFPLENTDNVILTGCPNNFSSINALIERRDSSNIPIWSYCIHPQYGGIYNTRFNLSSDKGILFTSSIDSTNFGANESVYFLKLDSNGLILNTNMNIYNETPSISIYPNPVYDKIFFSSSIKKIKQIIVLDILGHELMTFNDNTTSELDVHKLTNGVYFLKIKLDSSEVIKKFLKL